TRLQPALGEDVADGERDGFELLARSGLAGVEDVIEDEAAFVERVARAAERDRPAAIAFEEFGNSVGRSRTRSGRCCGLAHRGTSCCTSVWDCRRTTLPTAAEMAICEQLFQ